MSFQTSVKTEPIETIWEILDTHSPDCELHMQITNIVSLRSGSHSPTITEDYSTDSTIIAGVITLQAYLLHSSSLTQDGSNQSRCANIMDISPVEGHLDSDDSHASELHASSAATVETTHTGVYYSNSQDATHFGVVGSQEATVVPNDSQDVTSSDTIAATVDTITCELQ